MTTSKGWIVFSLFIALAVAPLTAGAGDKADHKHHKHKHKHHGHGDQGQPPAKLAHGVEHGGPPPWAPAHGYRRKHGKRIYVAPYGIDIGTCHRDIVGAALGGTAGGLIASSIAKGSDRPAAIVGGVLLGALLGGAIADAMDPLDRGCLGQVLEHGSSNQPVRWENPDRASEVLVTPTRTYRETSGDYCREYQTTVRIGGREEQAFGRACRQPDGSWQRS